MIYVFYFFAAVLVFLGWQSLRGGFFYLEYFREKLAEPESEYTPFCSIIAPCRGLDEGLRENFAALFRQNYPRFEIIFVVDDERDAAVSVIEKLMAQPPAAGRSFEAAISRAPLPTLPARLCVAGKAIAESQKVHNLRHAATQISDESEALVFVDSDARPNDRWLRHLVAPLRSDDIGCATGYRWLIADKSKNFSFASELRSVWNASVASALGANLPKNFCWGGATAIRRDVFEKLNVRERWRGTLSDDFALTRLMNESRLPVCFVPQCLTATLENCTFGELLEFSTRQMKITRVYAAHLWKASLAGSFFFSIVFWTGIVLLFVLAGVHFWLTFFLVAAIFALGAGKSFLRIEAAKSVLPEYRQELNRQYPPHLILWTITPLLYFYNCVCALFSRVICWRGIRYELKSATETVILTTKP